MKLHEIANKLIKHGYCLTGVSEYKDLYFQREYEIGITVIVKKVRIIMEDGIDKVEASKYIDGQAEKVDGDEYIIQHDYDLINIKDGVMFTKDGREFAL